MAFKFNASASGSEADIQITGVIGDDFWSEEPCTTEMVRKALGQAPNAKLIKAFVDTDGGDVWQGFGIYQALLEHPARVEVTVGARAQSCGSLIAMAGDSVSMHETSKLLVHNPWSIMAGDAAKLEKRAKDLRNLEDSFVTAYASRSGMSEEDTRKLMDEDRLMSAAEAKTLGFCTDIRKAPKKGDSASAMSDQELTDAMSKLRNKVQASATALRIAAMSPPQPTNEPPAPLPAEAAREKTMPQLAVVLAALCLAEGVSDNEATVSINALKSAKGERDKLLEAVGAKSTDEAVGLVKALSEKAALADASAKQLADNKAKALADKKTALIVAASTPAKSRDVDPSNPHAGKLTPALKGWAEASSIETLEGFLAGAPVVLVGDGVREPTHATGGNGGTVVLSHNGKTFAQMPPKARAELKKDNPELYASMRQTWIDSGSPAAATN
jgi:ATP-dependent protease ClpP protease subunit